MLTGAAIFIGKTAIHIGTAALDIKVIKHSNHPEIAFVHDVDIKFQSQKDNCVNKGI